MTKIGEIVTKVRIKNHIPTIMTPIYLITRSSNIKAMERKKAQLAKGNGCYICGWSRGYVSTKVPWSYIREMEREKCIRTRTRCNTWQKLPKYL